MWGLNKCNKLNDMTETQFDYLTEIEKDLLERGYKRLKYDHKKKELVEMALNGDASYYFSLCGNIYFHYRKNDLDFIVGLQEKDMPPMLIGCNRRVNFNNEYRYLSACRSIPVQWMLSEIGNLKFIESVENNVSIDFDMRVAENLYCGELVKPKDVGSEYVYESKTCLF